MRQTDRFSDDEVFSQAGITAEDASLIAERLIAQLEAEERKAAEEEALESQEIKEDETFQDIAPEIADDSDYAEE